MAAHVVKRMATIIMMIPTALFDPTTEIADIQPLESTTIKEKHVNSCHWQLKDINTENM